MGPSIEYYIKGMEIGNMVFMQYKTFPDGKFEELKVKVIDTGISLERVAWMVDGDPTSYFVTFNKAKDYLFDKLKMKIDYDFLYKVCPLLCTMNVDEVDDLDK